MLVSHQICDGKDILFLDFMLICFERMSTEELTLFCVVLLRNWFNRNCMVHVTPGLVLIDVVSWAEAFISDLK